VDSHPSRSARYADLGESILYVCALIADQPRAIDRYIDFFAESPRHRHRSAFRARLTPAARPPLRKDVVSTADMSAG
jgi:hypothetical protein